MSIPDYQTIMKPLLEYLKENSDPNRMQDVINAMMIFFNLSEKEKGERMPSGQQAIIDNRVAWARTHLKKAGLLADPKRGYVQINKKRLEVIIENNTPAFFESLVLDLLSKMGYGKGQVTGRSGDGGIDGFISQDALGIEKIYFQAKRFTGSTKVSASMVRDFVGSLDLKSVSKGVFITSTDFPANTEQVLSGTHKSIILINQEKLLSLMIKYNVGVSIEKLFEVKKLDSDYFPED